MEPDEKCLKVKELEKQVTDFRSDFNSITSLVIETEETAELLQSNISQLKEKLSNLEIKIVVLQKMILTKQGIGNQRISQLLQVIITDSAPNSPRIKELEEVMG